MADTGSRESGEVIASFPPRGNILQLEQRVKKTQNESDTERFGG